MQHDHTDRSDTEPPAIQNRVDTGGPWSTAWPLVALALIGLVLVRACVSAPPPPAAPPASAAPGSR